MTTEAKIQSVLQRVEAHGEHIDEVFDLYERLSQAGPATQAEVQRLLDGEPGGPIISGDVAPQWPPLLKKTEAAKYLGLHVSTIHRMIRAGTLHPVSLNGGNSYIKKTELDAFIAHTPVE
ncbi:MAG: helix-turn-helix domain-containing protein [Candidatus Marinimicrobia bacterium]|nr:helix-turn-helix domain-containing protein [Candidatus Neomarinimicrobiota bacterium]